MIPQKIKNHLITKKDVHQVLLRSRYYFTFTFYICSTWGCWTYNMRDWLNTWPPCWIKKITYPSWGRWYDIQCHIVDSWLLLHCFLSASRPASAADRTGGSISCSLYTCRGSPTLHCGRLSRWQNTPNSVWRGCLFVLITGNMTGANHSHFLFYIYVMQS